MQYSGEIQQTNRRTNTLVFHPTMKYFPANINDAEEHALINPFRRVAGVTPYSLPVRLWLGTPQEASAAGIGLGLGAAYAAFELSGGDLIMGDNSSGSISVFSKDYQVQ